MTWQLVVLGCFSVLVIACVFAGTAILIWKMGEAHRAQLSEFADRVQAPEAAHVAAYEQFMPRKPDHELSDATFPPVPLDEDFRLAEILEGE